MTPDPPELLSSARLTAFLTDFGRGDPEAEAALMPHVQLELRRIAGALMRDQPPEHTLQATELVHEAYLKLSANAGHDLADRRHFYRLAARAMRQLLVDHARRKRSVRRGGQEVVLPLDEALSRVREEGLDWAELDAALEELAALDRREAQVVELRYFGGLPMERIAESLDVSVSTIERDWRSARAWLAERLDGRA